MINKQRELISDEEYIKDVMRYYDIPEVFYGLQSVKDLKRIAKNLKDVRFVIKLWTRS